MEMIFYNVYDFVRSASNLDSFQDDNTLLIKIAQKSVGLTNLFELGLLLSFIHKLKKVRALRLGFWFDDTMVRRCQNLESIGFFSYCKQHEISCRKPILKSSQRRLFPSGKKSYFQCLLPLSSFSFKIERNETDALQYTHLILRKVHDDIVNNHLGQIKYSDIANELEIIIYDILKELILNTIIHSKQGKICIALTAERESSSKGHKQHKHLKLRAGQDKFSFLVMDVGIGVYRSLSLDSNHPKLSDYNSIKPYSSDFDIIYEKENALLKTIFNGNLVARKGRKSEGLEILKKKLDWFEGVLSYHTGRNRIDISCELLDMRDDENRRLYFPGVVAAAVLPSKNLRTRTARMVVGGDIVEGSEEEDFELDYDHQLLPIGLFGGQSEMELRYKCEVYARELVESIRPFCIGERAYFRQIDLSLSKNVNVDFLDTLIQELLKADADAISQIVFSNCRREVISQLRRRNCSSWLMRKDKFILFLDDTDQPYFLGAPLIDLNKSLTFQDFLSNLLFNGSARVKELEEIWQYKETKVAIIREYIFSNHRGPFFLDSKDHMLFRAYRVISKVQSNRKKHTAHLNHHFLREPGKLFSLQNGNIMDSLVDFPEFWGDAKRLFDCSKLLLSKINRPIVPTLLSFMHNGDRLAAEMLRLSVAGKLIIVDPHDSPSWDHIEIVSDFAIVVDVLYPGDKEGYIASLIKKLIHSEEERTEDMEHHFYPKYIIAFADFRPLGEMDKFEIRSSETNVIQREHSLPVFCEVDSRTKGLNPPQIVLPIEHHVIAKRIEGGTLPEIGLHVVKKPEQLPKMNEKIYLGKAHFEYSDIELSAEFWHNACALKVITSQKTGRESRNILFYENNERIIENERTRALLEEFVISCVKNDLHLRIEVILHPNHPVGAFLAQLVSRQLNKPPLILKLRQRKYGGKIEISREDQASFRSAIEERKIKSKRSNLRAIIVDDSVISGSSIFTMVGLATKLGLDSCGILVVLNRLSPQVSAALSAMPFKFSYLYRLHIPMLTDSQDPDKMIKDWRKFIDSGISSVFAHSWSQKIRQKESYLRSDDKMIESTSGLQIDEDVFKEAEITIFHPYELKKIINGLLLHEDPNILDLSTRLAIANNFLEHLVEEKVFWSFLRCLVSRGFKERRETNEIYFVRKLICLMAFSRYIRPVVCHTFFRDFCLEILKLGIKGDNWQAVPNLVCDLTLALVAIGTKNFMGVDPDFVCRLLSALLEDGNSKKKETAKEIIGAYSASLGVLRRIREVMLTEVLRKKIAKSFPVTRIEDHDDDLCFELNMGLMNVYEPFIKMDHEFRKRLGILPRSDQDGYLKDLDQEREQQEGKIGSGADMLNYMVEAPGYTCVLKTMLMATNADTVLLFAKNSTKVGDSYFLRDFDTRGLSRPKDSLALHQLQDSSFLKPIQMRMKENLFFFSRKPRDLQDLNNYSMTPHSCMFGTSIRQACAGREQYYVIFGFHQGWESSNTFRTTFYYWLRFEPILREILPLILEKHIVSSTSWNALLQAVRPIHRHGPDSDPKKAMLSRAMNITDLGQYLISAINMTTPRAMSGRDLVDKIRKIKASFIQKLNRADKKYKDSGPLPIDSKKLRKNLIIQIAPLISTYSQFITFHDSILDFILTESLGNAVAACDGKIKLELELKPIKDHASNIKTTSVNVKISNPSCQKESPEGQGIPACRLAANAVGGFFDSKFNDEAEKWEAKLSLPAYQVPTKLTGGWLNAFFNK